MKIRSQHVFQASGRGEQLFVDIIENTTLDLGGVPYGISGHAGNVNDRAYNEIDPVFFSFRLGHDVSPCESARALTPFNTALAQRLGHRAFLRCLEVNNNLITGNKSKDPVFTIHRRAEDHPAFPARIWYTDRKNEPLNRKYDQRRPKMAGPTFRRPAPRGPGSIPPGRISGDLLFLVHAGAGHRRYRDSLSVGRRGGPAAKDKNTSLAGRYHGLPAVLGRTDCPVRWFAAHTVRADRPVDHGPAKNDRYGQITTGHPCRKIIRIL